MGKVLVSESNLTNIANAIRTKNGSSNTYTPAQMATAIGDIQTGITPSGSKSIEENGTHDVTNYASAVVDVKNISASYQTSTPNQTVEFYFPNRSWAEDGEIRLSFTRPKITLSPDEGYVAGHIVINGVDTGSSTLQGQDIHEGDVITFTQAVSLYNLNTTITVGHGGDEWYTPQNGNTVYKEYGYKTDGGHYGSIGNNSMWYYDSYYDEIKNLTVKNVVLDFNHISTDGIIYFSVTFSNSLPSGVSATVFVGDSSPSSSVSGYSNYWTHTTQPLSGSNTGIGGIVMELSSSSDDGRAIFSYFTECHDNQTPIPIKIELSNNPS